MSVGHSPEQKAHLPDMQKKPEEITQAERNEAKRRIGGSLAPESSATASTIVK